MERKLLQTAILIAATVPVAGGAAGVILGADFLRLPYKPRADSQIRYLSGLLLGIGLSYWSLIPRIEKNATRFSLLTLLVMVGGLARVFGLIAARNAPDYILLLTLTIELVVTPV